MGIAGGGDYPPPGPLPCPACGGARSEPGGRSDSFPPMGITQLGTPCLSLSDSVTAQDTHQLMSSLPLVVTSAGDV